MIRDHLSASAPGQEQNAGDGGEEEEDPEAALACAQARRNQVALPDFRFDEQGALLSTGVFVHHFTICTQHKFVSGVWPESLVDVDSNIVSQEIWWFHFDKFEVLLETQPPPPKICVQYGQVQHEIRGVSTAVMTHLFLFVSLSFHLFISDTGDLDLDDISVAGYPEESGVSYASFWDKSSGKSTGLFGVRTDNTVLNSFSEL